MGTVKIAPGATSTPSAKNETIKLSGTLEGCTGFDDVPSKYPITAGTFVATVKLPSGATCSSPVAGAPLDAKVTVVWKGINPRTGKLATAAPSDSSTFVSFTESSGPNGFDATSPALAGKRSLFRGEPLSFHLTIDESTSEIAALCAAKGGLKTLFFTGVNGPSTIVVGTSPTATPSATPTPTPTASPTAVPECAQAGPCSACPVAGACVEHASGTPAFECVDITNLSIGSCFSDADCFPIAPQLKCAFAGGPPGHCVLPCSADDDCQVFFTNNAACVDFGDQLSGVTNICADRCP